MCVSSYAHPILFLLHIRAFTTFVKNMCDRLLASVLNTIEVVKISFPQGLVLISRRQLRY